MCPAGHATGSSQLRRPLICSAEKSRKSGTSPSDSFAPWGEFPQQIIFGPFECPIDVREEPVCVEDVSEARCGFCSAGQHHSQFDVTCTQRSIDITEDTCRRLSRSR